MGFSTKHGMTLNPEDPRLRRVGMYPEMADVCLELATEALATATPIEFVGLVGGLTI